MKTTKTCGECGQEKPLSSFNKNRSRTDGVQSRCRECDTKIGKVRYKEKSGLRRLQVRQRIAVIREWFLGYRKTLQCEKCGDERWYVLDFHHRDSDKKDGNVADMVNSGYSKKRIVREIEKCSVFCANCHREEHFLGNIDEGKGQRNL